MEQTKIKKNYPKAGMGEILTKAQQKEVEDFVKKKNKDGKKIIDCTTDLKLLLGKWRKELAEKS